MPEYGIKIPQKKEFDINIQIEEKGDVVRLYGNDEFGVPIERANIPLLVETLLDKAELLPFEDFLKEEFLVNTENYPKEYHQLFNDIFNRAKERYEKQP